MLNALVFIPAVIAALSLTLALQSPTNATSRRTQGTESVWSQFIAVITNLNLASSCSILSDRFFTNSQFYSSFSGSRSID